MKATAIHFYSPLDNSEPQKKSTPKEKAVPVTGYIGTSGKLVFPHKSITQLPFNPDETFFKIGTDPGKRKIKSLYLVPASEGEEGTFEMIKSARGYSIPLALILQKGGIDFADVKYKFTVEPFEFDGGVTAYELQLVSNAPKAEYTGKPRGRKRKNPEVTE